MLGMLTKMATTLLWASFKPTPSELHLEKWLGAQPTISYFVKMQVKCTSNANYATYVLHGISSKMRYIWDSVSKYINWSQYEINFVVCPNATKKMPGGI